MELSEQLEVLEEFAGEAWQELLRRLAEPGARERLLALAREGLAVGHGKYGDASWRKMPDELGRDVDEELRDALVYLVIAIWRHRADAGA